MIVDVHTHAPKIVLFTKRDDFVAPLRPHDPPIKTAYTKEEYVKVFDPVEKAIVFGVARKGETPNDEIAEMVKVNPKFIGFLSVEPLAPGALKEMDRAVNELGMKGIKLGPTYQHYHPADKRAYPIYRKAQDLGLPILFHQATGPRREDPLEYAHPLLLERIALDFPDLKIVVAHMGHPWEESTIVMIRKQPNMYADVSALFYRPWQFFNSMRLCYEYGQMHKLLFGTDFPVTTPAESLERIRDLNHVVKGTGIPKVPEEEIERVIHQDSLKILGIK